MGKFIGVKLVEAVPMTASEADAKGYSTGKIVDNGVTTYPNPNGYQVIYEDGYKSWCPAVVFESSNRQIDSMTFGFAIEALKRGLRVARKGWNGKGMFLWLKPSVTVKEDWCHDPKLKELVHANGGEMEALGTICMKTADNKILTGWLASQTDMLSDDWVIVD